VNNNKKIRSCIIGSLIFSFLLAGCIEKNDKNNSISILWEQKKAVGIFIPQKLLSSVPKDSIEQLLQIHLQGSKVSILGKYIRTNDAIEFHPLIAFTHGLKYEVHLADKLLAEVEIPPTDTNDAPVVVSVYPMKDTLPGNLLKFYIQFSKPMQEGEALNHIRLIKNDRDTLSSVFLDLQPELWNNERTILTLWLDPGRIKRDLQPNKTLGPPLQPGEHYQLLIDDDWQDAEGALLKKDYQKSFFTAVRDSLSPVPETWTIYAPKAGTNQQLIISFNESLDHVLVKNTMRIIDAHGNIVNGIFNVNDPGSVLYFVPLAVWKPGKYTLEIESRLEDLAGNNLNRLFDTDLTQKQKAPKDIFKRSFEIR
jgi:hypothetical protein